MKKFYSSPILDIDEFKVAEVMTYSDISEPGEENPDTEF